MYVYTFNIHLIQIRHIYDIYNYIYYILYIYTHTWIARCVCSGGPSKDSSSSDSLVGPKCCSSAMVAICTQTFHAKICVRHNPDAQWVRIPLTNDQPPEWSTRPISSIKHQAPSIKHQASSITHQVHVRSIPEQVCVCVCVCARTRL